MKIPPHPPPKIGTQLECFVSYAHTPNEFYIQLVCQLSSHELCVVIATLAKHEVGETHDRVAGVCC